MLVRALLLALLAASLAACSVSFSIGGGGAKVDDVVLSTEVDPETSRPRNNFTEFPSTVTTIYATVEVHNMDAGERFVFRWLQGGELGRELEVTLDEDITQGWVYSSLEFDEGLPPGDDYAVEVYRGDRLESTKQFSVRADDEGG